MHDDDLLRFHNGDTLHNIPVVREEQPRTSPWRTVGMVAGMAALVGSAVGLSFGLGDRHHPAQTVAAANTSPPASATTTPSAQPVVTATATVQAPTRTQTVYAAPTDVDGTTAESVVEQYYAAVNAQDYASAWALGGKNLSPSYDAFVDGYADTTYTQAQVTSTDGETVYVRLDALRDDGSTAVYTGSYTVDTGRDEISHGNLAQVD
ncbi:hypothetical protein LXH13_04395 [Streptomyces spinosirectus]|jgi:hypothetical protein|uniref:hypothetical protein n=1 Tax=Streptomyces TaxID=1883 RepID=UPI001C9E149E|nr:MULTISPECIES: hypothetical protein [Streptomyces]MBY8338423.1 hypothetical protein [Streptomyces plumbidurans]UIR16314.1 hypothetical protein LXH13_04395 [Streptomyces spinosirectus]